jgi:homoserine/homoserine lactone efflux protein
MSFTTWFSFFCAACLIAISPGSGAILSMSHGLAYGFKKASVTIFGLQLGLILVLVIAGAGVGSLLLASETAFNVVKLIGAGYLIYLGLTQFFAKSKSESDAAVGSTKNSGAQLNVPHPSRRILTGFLTNASNPKGIIFMVAVLPSFMDSRAPLLPQLSILGVTMVVIDTTVMHGYAFLASSFQQWLNNPKVQNVQNRVFGAVLMMVGASLFFVKREASIVD